MRSIEEFNSFFDEKIAPQLQSLEDYRVSTIKKRRNVILTVISVTLCTYPVIFFMAWGWPYAVVSTLLCGSVGFGLLKKMFRIEDDTKALKQQIMMQVVSFLNPTSGYQAKSFVETIMYKFVLRQYHFVYRSDMAFSYREFMDGKLFLDQPDRYESKFFVAGKLQGRTVNFSEVFAGQDGGVGDIFRGLLFVAEMPHPLAAPLSVVPNTTQKYFTHLGETVKEYTQGRGDLIMLHDPDFDTEFAIYSPQADEARDDLPEAVLEIMLEYKQQYGINTYASFQDNKLYFAIDLPLLLAEANLDSLALDQGFVKTYLERISLGMKVMTDTVVTE